jgi:hypothetical protein
MEFGGISDRCSTEYSSTLYSSDGSLTQSRKELPLVRLIAPPITVIIGEVPRVPAMPALETDKDFSPYDPRGKLYGFEIHSWSD